MVKEHIQVVFLQDQVVNIAENDSYSPPNPKDSLKGAEDGEYIVVNCGIGLVSKDGQSACSEVSALKASVVSRTLSPGKDSQQSVEISEFALNGLSKAQREQVIDAFGSKNMAWAWKYATADVKLILSGTLSNEDIALKTYQNALIRFGKDSNYQIFKASVQEALQLAPKMNGLRCELGKAAIKNNKVEEAISLFNDEINKASDAKLLTAHSYLCAIFAAQGKGSEANQHANLGMQTREFQKIPSKLSPEVVAQINAAVQFRFQSDYHQNAAGEPGANPKTNELNEADLDPVQLPNRNSIQERYGCLSWGIAIILFFLWSLFNFQLGSDKFFAILMAVMFFGGLLVQLVAYFKRINKK